MTKMIVVENCCKCQFLAYYYTEKKHCIKSKTREKITDPSTIPSWCPLPDAPEEKAIEALDRIRTWAKAYPVSVFPEPDLKKAHELLKAGGLTLDQVSASSFRFLLNQIIKIIDERIKSMATDLDGWAIEDRRIAKAELRWLKTKIDKTAQEILSPNKSEALQKTLCRK
jgi:hypothetical protein